MIIKLAAIKRDSKFRVQNGSELSNTIGMNLVCASVAHCSSIVAVAAFGVFLGVIVIHYSGGLGRPLVTPWRFLFLFMILKKRVHCSPDQETERVIFAAGLGFHLLYNWSLQSNSCRIFCEIFSTHATIKILSRKSAFALSHALRTTFRTA